MSLQVRGPAWPFVALTTLAVVFFFGFPVSTQGPGRGRIVRVNGAEAIEGEVLIKYRDGRARASQAAVEAAADVESVESLNRHGVRRIRSRRLRTAELLALLAQDPDVEYVEPNYVIRLVATPNDSSFDGLWGLFNTGFNTVGGAGTAGADIDAPGAWDLTTGTRDHVVAVLDTGIDYNHPDLAANMWSAPSSYQVTIGGVPVTCGAGTHGFNAINRTCDPMDDHFHGTHVAGTIGASGNNGAGVTGINWTTSMMAVKILGSSGSGTLADALTGLEYVLQVKAAFASTDGADIRVLSNSWDAGGNNISLSNAVKATNASDMLFVAAAGNNGTNNDNFPVFPAAYSTYSLTPNVVAVAASTNTDQRASFSNYGATTVQLAAPGASVLSTVPGNSYGVASGTSMAAPHVSGAAMLALSLCDMTTPQLKALLLNSVDLVPAFSGITSTGGRLNARAAVQSCPNSKVTSLTLTPSVASPQVLGTTVTWTAVPAGGIGPYEYRWFVWDGTSSTQVQGWAAENSFVWTPGTVTDKYAVTVQVRSAWNKGASEASDTEHFEIATRASSVTLTSNLVAPQGLGASVTWTASAAGGLPPYQYRFLQYDGLYWTEARAWSTSDTFTWTPTVANTEYKIAVLVRSAGSTGASEISASKPFAIRAVATAVTLTSNLTAPQLPGTAITFTANPSGGEAPYDYQFSVWDGLAWTVAKAWSTSPIFLWTPGVANADYKIVVKVRSVWNTGASETYASRAFSILPPVATVTLTPNLAPPRLVGTTVTFTATASGGQAPYQYQWRVWGGSTWTVVQGWSSSNVFTWTPSSPSNPYQVQVQVRGTWNTGAPEREAALNYQVFNPLTVTLTSNLSSPRPASTTIRWTAHPSGQSQARYQWVLFDGTAWLNLTGWVTSNTFDWTPAVPNGAYRFGVRVRADWNTGAAESTVIQPFVIQ